MKSSNIGGQAVLEGIMMKNQDRYAVAVRKPDGEIFVQTETFHSITGNWKKLTTIPFVRGVFNFIDSMVLGIKTLTFSASFYEEEEEKEKEEVKVKKIDKETSSDIIVAGIDNIKVSLASCCDPVYGDSIVGYITKGNGISIHRATCPNLLRMDDRLVSVSWSNNPASKYSVDLVIYSNTSDNNLADIIATTSKIDANINGVKIIDRGSNTVYEMACFVKNLEHLEKVLVELNKKPYINNIERLMQ